MMRRECKSYAHNGVLVVWDWNYHGDSCPLCNAKREVERLSRAQRMTRKLEGFVLNVAEAAREWLWARKLVRETGKDEGIIEQADARLTEAVEALDEDLLGRRLAEAIANGGS